jgi:hypothetical protein
LLKQRRLRRLLIHATRPLRTLSISHYLLGIDEDGDQKNRDKLFRKASLVFPFSFALVCRIIFDIQVLFGAFE